MNDGAFTRFHLAELASHGYLVIASDRILSGPCKPPIDLSKPLPMPDGPPKPATLPADLTGATDLALAENVRKGSPLFGKIRDGAIAISGGSYGGQQALQIAASDPHVRIAVNYNSGIFGSGSRLPGIDIDKSALDRLHAPLIYILGGPTDIAYGNGMDEYARISRVTVAIANDRDAGHGGSFFDPNGGEGAQVAVARLDWQLKGSRRSARMFTGKHCVLCAKPGWDFTITNLTPKAH